MSYGAAPTPEYVMELEGRLNPSLSLPEVLQFVSMGPLKHTGKGGYFAAGPPLPDGREPRQATADHIVQVLVDAGLASDNFAAQPEV